MAGRYAADTSVSSESSRGEIERTLSRYGANQFMYGWGEHEGAEVAIVGFRAHDSVLPRVAEAYGTGSVPSLLPTYRRQIEA